MTPPFADMTTFFKSEWQSIKVCGKLKLLLFWLQFAFVVILDVDQDSIYDKIGEGAALFFGVFLYKLFNVFFDSNVQHHFCHIRFYQFF